MTSLGFLCTVLQRRRPLGERETRLAWEGNDDGKGNSELMPRRIPPPVPLVTTSKLHAYEQSHQQIARYEQRKGELLAAVQELEKEIVDLKVQRKSKPKHITLADLPEADRVRQLAPGRKQLTDTIKLIAYRAESALVATVRERLKRHDDARSLVRGLMHTTVNLRPDPIAKRLTIELHGQSNPAHDKVIEHLCAELNQTETLYPGTALTLFYHPLRSSNFLPDQDV